MLTASRRFLGFLGSSLSEPQEIHRTADFPFRDEAALDSIGEYRPWVRMVWTTLETRGGPKNSEEREDVAGDGEGAKYGEGGGGGCESSSSSSPSSARRQHNKK